MITLLLKRNLVVVDPATIVLELRRRLIVPFRGYKCYTEPYDFNSSHEKSFFLKYDVIRFSKYKEKDIKEKIVASTMNRDHPQKKKTKEVYLVNKVKWNMTATTEELKTLNSIIFDGTNMDDKHRIIQYKIRSVTVPDTNIN